MPARAATRLTTNELRKRLAAFAHQWQGTSSERADEKLFTADFLACFGIAAHQYQREYRVTLADGGMKLDWRDVSITKFKPQERKY